MILVAATKFENFSHKELEPSNEELKGNEILFRNDQKIFDLVRHSDFIWVSTDGFSNNNYIVKV